ncbi:MAG: RsmE family RNA methyltransferase, partial [Lentimonas sp.]
MNLILFDEPFESVRLDSGDVRAEHLRKVLRAEVGSLVFIGFVNGPRARAQVVSVGPDGSYDLKVIATEPAPEQLPITLLIGLPRPHTARRILFEAASLGVAAMHFFPAKHSEPSYAASRLWQTDEWRERIFRGTEQAFGTHLPQVEVHSDMPLAMAIPQESSTKIA